jgi:hypothetical protein
MTCDELNSFDLQQDISDEVYLNASEGSTVSYSVSYPPPVDEIFTDVLRLIKSVGLLRFGEQLDVIHQTGSESLLFLFDVKSVQSEPVKANNLCQLITIGRCCSFS